MTPERLAAIRRHHQQLHASTLETLTERDMLKVIDDLLARVDELEAILKADPAKPLVDMTFPEHGILGKPVFLGRDRPATTLAPCVGTPMEDPRR